MPISYVTTSWDDGQVGDERCLRILDQYKLRGTFYICSDFNITTLPGDLIEYLARAQEIGAHTIDHPILPFQSDDEVLYQVAGSKDALEQLLGQPVDMFCYPSGAYNKRVRSIVEQAGFRGARTTERFVFKPPQDPFTMGTTLRVFPYPYLPKSFAWKKWRFATLSNVLTVRGITQHKLPLTAYKNWLELAKATFDCVYKQGGVWHLWGHSWEVEQFGMWEQFEEICQYIAGHTDVAYMTNGELVAQLQCTSISEIAKK